VDGRGLLKLSILKELKKDTKLDILNTSLHLATIYLGRTAARSTSNRRNIALPEVLIATYVLTNTTPNNLNFITKYVTHGIQPCKYVRNAIHDNLPHTYPTYSRFLQLCGYSKEQESLNKDRPT